MQQSDVTSDVQVAVDAYMASELRRRLRAHRTRDPQLPSDLQVAAYGHLALDWSRHLATYLDVPSDVQVAVDAYMASELRRRLRAHRTGDSQLPLNGDRAIKFFCHWRHSLSSRVPHFVLIDCPRISSVSTLHCLTVSLAHGGSGLGAAWGERLAKQLIADAGFTEVEVHDVPKTRSAASTFAARALADENGHLPHAIVATIHCVTSS